MNATQTKELIKTAWRAAKAGSKLSLCLVGESGVGKSAIAYQSKEELKREIGDPNFQLVELRLSQAVEGDLIGILDKVIINNKKTAKFLPPEVLPTEGNGILLIDEFNRATKQLRQAAFQLIYDKEISLSRYKLPPGFLIIIAINPDTENYSVEPFEMAEIRRMVHIWVDPSKHEFLNYAKEAKFNKELVEVFEKDYTSIVREDSKKKPEFGYKVTFSHRGVEFLSDLMNVGLSEHLFAEVSDGTIGKEATIDLLKAREKHVDSMLTLSDIFKCKQNDMVLTLINPEGTKGHYRIDKLMNPVNEFLELSNKQWDSMLENKEKCEKFRFFIRNLPSELRLQSYALMMETLKKTPKKLISIIEGEEVIFPFLDSRDALWIKEQYKELDNKEKEENQQK